MAEKLGKGPFDRESIAVSLGFKGLSGTAASVVGTLVHFGLLERSGPNTYIQSPLVERILRPVDQQEHDSAIIEAILKPRLYEALISKYSGQSLPTMLPNILTRTYGITPSAASRAEQIFKESCEFAGILKNGVLRDQSVLGATLPPDPVTVVTAQPSAPRHEPVPPPTHNVVLRFPIAAGVYLMVPDDLMTAFALGEFAEPVRSLREKLDDWAKSNTQPEEDL
ncbi:MAG: hypothetical protein PHC70_00660 [Patescibacteria group bacterium]|nr:hypothetical protein [Patescibacteria group bacterium]